jgi:hypothetical protein
MSTGTGIVIIHMEQPIGLLETTAGSPSYLEEMLNLGE